MKRIELEELQKLQEVFEDERKLEAVRKYRKNDHKLRYEMKGGYMSTTPQGRGVVAMEFSRIRPYLLNNIKNQMSRVREETRYAILIADIIGEDQLLGICLKAIIDSLGKYKVLKSIKLATLLGQRLRIEFYRQIWNGYNPDAVGWIEREYKDAGIWHKLAASKVILGNATGKTVEELNLLCPHHAFTKAGSWVMEAVANGGWIENETRWVKKNTTQNFLKLTDKFDAWYEKVGKQIEHGLQVNYPMLCPPRDWDKDGLNGGYLKPIDRLSRLVKSEKGRNSMPGPTGINFVNTLQQTEWELNTFIVNIQDQLFWMEYGGNLGSFKPMEHHPGADEEMPQHILELPSDHQARIDWRKEKAALHTFNAESRRNGVRAGQNHTACELFGREGIERFWVPYGVDTRGRTYVLSAGVLSPQGSDAERALLRFHVGAEITPNAEKWLALHLANCYGINESHAAKAKWVESNIELISSIATDPFDHLEFVEGADEPFQFLAACDEYYRCVIAKTDTLTRLPVSLDATASGVQILSLLARDRKCAEQVNLIPGLDAKQDIYATLKPLVEEEIRKHENFHIGLANIVLSRKCYKANLMTRCYGSSLRSRRTKIRETILEVYGGRTDLLFPGDLQTLADCFEKAMKRLAPGALAIYDDLQALAVYLRDCGSPAKWTTPAGNFVELAPYKNETTRVQLGWFGRLRVSDPSQPQILDIKKVKSSLAPNFVHSLDADALHTAFHDWDRPLVTVHDCFSVRSTDVEDARDCMLRGYQTTLKDPHKILEDLARDNGYETEWSIIETFSEEDLDNLTHCEYAFC